MKNRSRRQVSLVRQASNVQGNHAFLLPLFNKLLDDEAILRCIIVLKNANHRLHQGVCDQAWLVNKQHAKEGLYGHRHRHATAQQVTMVTSKQQGGLCCLAQLVQWNLAQTANSEQLTNGRWLIPRPSHASACATAGAPRHWAMNHSTLP